MEKSWSRQHLEAEMKKNPRSRRNKPSGEFRDIPAGSEDEIQAQFFRWLGLYESRFPSLAKFFAIPNGLYLTRFGRYVTSLTGRKSGVPDTFLPVANVEFLGLWIEFKSAKGSPSLEQRDWCKFLRDAGFRVEVLRSWTDAANVTIDYLDLPIEKL